MNRLLAYVLFALFLSPSLRKTPAAPSQMQR